MYKVYGDSQPFSRLQVGSLWLTVGQSGNCYKVQLLMNHLDLEYQWQEIDILAGETQSEDFLAKANRSSLKVIASCQLPISHLYSCHGTFSKTL